MNDPFISVIMAVYNGEKYVLQAIESVLEQPRKDLELIVVDDGSTDSTAKIVQSVNDDRVKYYYKDNSGVSDSRNFGKTKTHGKYIAFLDADDVWCSQFYDDELYKTLCEKNSDIFYFSYLECNSDLKKGLLRHIKSGDDKFDYFGYPFPSYLYSSELVKRFDYSNIKLSEDVLFCYDCFCKADDIYAIDKPIFAYRYNVDSVTKTVRGKENIYENLLEIWQTKLDLPDVDKSAVKCCRQHILQTLLLYIDNQLKTGLKCNDILAHIKNEIKVNTEILYDKSLAPKGFHLNYIQDAIIKNNADILDYSKLKLLREKVRSLFKKSTLTRQLYYKLKVEKAFTSNTTSYTNA